MTEIRADIIKKALADRAKSRQNIFFTEVYTNDGEYYNQRFDGVEFHGVHNTKIYGYEITEATRILNRLSERLRGGGNDRM